MCRRVVGANPSSNRGETSARSSHRIRLREKATKIATPPRRGRGESWIWRPSCGKEIHPRRVAMSRTWRVATNDTASENANIPKKRSVKPRFPFRLKHPAFQAKLAERILRLFFQNEVFLPSLGNLQYFVAGTIHLPACGGQLFQYSEGHLPFLVLIG